MNHFSRKALMSRAGSYPPTLDKITESSDDAGTLADSTRHKEVTLHPVRLKVDDYTSENAFGVFTARIEAEGSADLSHTSRLMDVPVKPEERLGFLNDSANGHTSAALHGGLTMHKYGAETFVNLLTGVEARSDRGCMYVEDAATHVGDLKREHLKPIVQFILRALPRCLPRGSVCPSAAEHLVKVVNLDCSTFGVYDRGGALQHVVYGQGVVVATCDIEFQSGTVQPFFSQFDPTLQSFNDKSRE